jgi:predicted flap endonuclease-1-like 5' DNA nuclease
MFEEPSPYLLALLSLVIGVALGWFLRSVRKPPASGRRTHQDAGAIQRIRMPQARPAYPNGQAPLASARRERRPPVRHHDDLDAERIDAQLDYLNDAIESARRHLNERDNEYEQLVVRLDERWSAIHEMEDKLREVEQRRDTLLETIAHRLEELDLLSHLSAKWETDVDRLSQHLQWQDGHLSRLRQAINERSHDLDDAENLLAQRDAKLQRLIRLRETREAALQQTESALNRYDTRLEELIQQHRQAPPDYAAQQPRSVLRPERRPASGPPRLPAGHPASRPPDTSPDDLTRIRGLVEVFAERLREAGIENYDQLAHATPDQIMAILKTPGHITPDVESWIRKARELVDDENPPEL